MKKTGIMLFCCMFATTAHAGGFANTDMSASGMGVANAVVAGADDVSAAAYNPAGLAWQDGIQGMVGTSLQSRNSSVNLGTGIASNMGSQSNLNQIYASWMPHDGNVGFSLAYNKPYSVDNDWSTAFPGSAGKTFINVDRLSLDAIYRVNSSMAFAVGADMNLATATLSQGTSTFSGGLAPSFGGHLSMKWKPAPMWSVGALLRMGSTLSFSDSANQSLKVKLPDELTVGIAYDLADEVRLELNVNWSRWSKLDNLNVMSGATIVQANNLDLKDSLILMLGATWFWRENSQFRFGYAYDQGASSSSAFNPALADQSGHKLTLGMGGDMFGVHPDIALFYTFYPENSVTGPYAGSYRESRFGLALSISKHF